MAISNFHIAFNKPDNHRYKPGDDFSGKVVMDVWAPTDIKYVEFLIWGEGQIRAFNDTSTYLGGPKSEIYLDKKMILIGSRDNRILLEPGRYVTNFRYTLPEQLPPTVYHDDRQNGYVFNISYMVQARVCDSVRAKSTRMVHHGQNKYTRIMKAVKKPFYVMQPINWSVITDTLEEVTHIEAIKLGCSSPGSEPVTVTLELGRIAHMAGDNINLRVKVDTEDPERVRSILSEVHQRTRFYNCRFSRCVISNKDRVELKWGDTKINHGGYKKTRDLDSIDSVIDKSYVLPLSSDLAQSEMKYCSMLKVDYDLRVIVSFNRFGGKLVMCVPITILPVSNADQMRKSFGQNNIPVFNKPTMFPYFTKPTESNAKDGLPASSAASMTTAKPAQNSDLVQSYFTGGAKCCTCC